MELELEMWKYVLISVFCHSSVQGDVPIIDFQHNCGSAVVRENVGNLVFDADDLPSYLYDNRCSVHITQPDSDSSIMFYFETFELSSSYPDCKDTNLTITGGDLNYRKTVPGLAQTMCGDNNTLLETGMNFTTSEEELTFTYSYSDYGKRLPGKFSIKFFVYHTDTKCDGDDDYMCSDGHCVSTEYVCSEMIRVCFVEDCDQLLKTAAGIVEQLTNIAKNIGWIVMIVVVFYLLRTCYKGNKARMWEFINGKFRQGRRNSRDEDAARTSLQLELVSPPEPLQTDQNTHHSRRSSLNSSLSSSMLSLPGVTLTSTDDATSPIAQPIQPMPTAPPPSYEDVMAPSYDDVIANEYKYKQSAPH